jgi:hypothetical protein
MEKALVPVRDLTDPDQNQAVLEIASALAGGRAAVAAEAAAAARSKQRLSELTGPVHLSVVWAM